MSQENVEIAHKLFDAFTRRDWGTVLECLDPDILARLDPTWPEQRVYGREAYLAFLKSSADAWGTDTSIDELVDLGDRLLMRICWRTRGHHSGIEGIQRWSQITTMRDGRHILIEFFVDHTEALKAVGLEE